MTYHVIIGIEKWRPTTTTLFAEHLVRGLQRNGHNCQILITEPRLDKRIEACRNSEFPDDLTFVQLPVHRDDTWAQRWESLERYLEERAPCIYLMLHDWRYNVVASRLSNRVRLIGIIQTGSELEINQAQQFGYHWESVIATSYALHFKLLVSLPHFAAKIHTVDCTLSELYRPPAKARDNPVQLLLANDGDNGEYINQVTLLSNNRTMLSQPSTERFCSIQDSQERVEDMIASCLKILEKIELMSAKHKQLRQRFHISPPSQTGGEIPNSPGPYDMDAAEVSHLAMWPNPPSYGSSKKELINTTSSLPALNCHKIFISASPQYISGVDVFAIHLVRGLRKKGLNACILTSSETKTDKSLLDLTDLPIEVIDYPDYLGWQARWQLLINKLSNFGPAIYIPNYDYANSCIATRLPSNVRVVGIGHSDDPIHYEHLCRIGHGCDAIVGVSAAITQHLSKLAPQFTNRLSTIPYGVQDCPPFQSQSLLAQSRGQSEQLRIAFTGRLVRSQKRAEDVIAIAKELSRRNIRYEMVIVGDGDMRNTMEKAAGALMIDSIRFTGAQPNEITLKFIETCDVLLLPSLFEGLSMSMLEAMSRAVVPVVSSIRSGVPDVIIDGQNGLIAPIADIQAFADRIEWLSNNRADLKRMAACAAETINQGYLTKNMVNNYVRLLEQVVSTPSERVPGPIVPPSCIAKELTLSKWMQRVFSDPKASIQRVYRRWIRN